MTWRISIWGPATVLWYFEKAFSITNPFHIFLFLEVVFFLNLLSPLISTDESTFSEVVYLNGSTWNEALRRDRRPFRTLASSWKQSRPLTLFTVCVAKGWVIDVLVDLIPIHSSWSCISPRKGHVLHRLIIRIVFGKKLRPLRLERELNKMLVGKHEAKFNP